MGLGRNLGHCPKITKCACLRTNHSGALAKIATVSQNVHICTGVGVPGVGAMCGAWA